MVVLTILGTIGVTTILALTLGYHFGYRCGLDDGRDGARDF